MRGLMKVAGLVALLFGGLLTASAIGQGRLTPEAREEILKFELTMPRANHLITALEAMTKYVVSLPDYQDRIRKSVTMTPAERIAQLEKDPKAAAILKENSLSAHDYMVGVPALRMALLAAKGGESLPNIAFSPANLAFAKANLAQLKPKLEAVDGIRPAK